MEITSTLFRKDQEMEYQIVEVKAASGKHLRIHLFEHQGKLSVEIPIHSINPKDTEGFFGLTESNNSVSRHVHDSTAKGIDFKVNSENGTSVKLELYTEESIR